MKYICWGPGAAAQTPKLLRRKREKKIEPVGAPVVLRAQLMCGRTWLVSNVVAR